MALRPVFVEKLSLNQRAEAGWTFFFLFFFLALSFKKALLPSEALSLRELAHIRAVALHDRVTTRRRRLNLWRRGHLESVSHQAVGRLVLHYF